MRTLRFTSSSSARHDGAPPSLLVFAPRLRRIDGYREYVAPQRRKLDDVLRKNRAGPRAIGALEDVEKALDGLGDAVRKNYEELTKLAERGRALCRPRAHGYGRLRRSKKAR